MEMKQILESKSVRDSLMKNVSVIDKVGKLVTLPNSSYSTKAQVAEFYNVGLTAISSLIHDNKDEIIDSGYKRMKGNDIIEAILKEEKIESKKGYLIVNNSIKLARGENGLFDRKTVLRIGMLLKDSEVAKKLRDYLLEVEEKTSEEIKEEALKSIDEIPDEAKSLRPKKFKLIATKTYDDIESQLTEISESKVNENETLRAKYAEALKAAVDSNDVLKIINSSSILVKHLIKMSQEEAKKTVKLQKELNSVVQELSDKVSVMESRGCTITDSRRAIIEIMKAIVKKNYGKNALSDDYEDAWNRMYDFAKISTGIDVRARDEKAPRRTLIDHVSEDEMKILEGFVRCYAMRCGVSPKLILDLDINLKK